MHGVVKKHTSTTKLWVVFDRSAYSSSGNSINDVLLFGCCSFSAIPQCHGQLSKVYKVYFLQKTVKLPCSNSHVHSAGMLLAIYLVAVTESCNF